MIPRAVEFNMDAGQPQVLGHIHPGNRQGPDVGIAKLVLDPGRQFPAKLLPQARKTPPGHQYRSVELATTTAPRAPATRRSTDSRIESAWAACAARNATETRARLRAS